MIWLKKIINGLLYENDQLSLTRVLAISGWLAFLLVSFYLVWKEVGWQNYETFASLTGGGGAATQIANKLINSKYNSPAGQPLDLKKESDNK
jgi:hypothetical protein